MYNIKSVTGKSVREKELRQKREIVIEIEIEIYQKKSAKKRRNEKRINEIQRHGRENEIINNVRDMK